MSPVKLEVLELLAQVAESHKFRQLSNDYGWNEKYATEYAPSISIPSGDILLRAQKLWKEKKDAGRSIAAVFLSDVSGSMAGSRLTGVKSALISGSEFVNPEHSIGLVLFNDEVRVVLPIGKFGLKQRAKFVAAARDMDASGGTAMYDGIVVALSLLVEEIEKRLIPLAPVGSTGGGLDATRAAARPG